MELREVMTTDVKTIGPRSTIREAAEQMAHLDIGAIPIAEGNRLLGMVTDRDITVRATAEGRDPNSTRVSDVMTSDVVYCYDDDTTEEAALKMRQLQIRRIPVVDRDKHLVGVLSLGDLALESDDDELVSQTLEGVSEP
jgi:CBS domain-containing protein